MLTARPYDFTGLHMIESHLLLKRLLGFSIFMSLFEICSYENMYSRRRTHGVRLSSKKPFQFPLILLVSEINLSGFKGYYSTKTWLLQEACAHWGAI